MLFRIKPRSHIDKEKETISFMIRLYCRKKQGNKDLCEECKALIEYAHARLDRCPLGEKKVSCNNCTVHCYKPDMREKVRLVMRYAGPRMFFYAPLQAIRHLLRK